MAGQRRKLTVFDRSTIEVRLRDGWGVRAIARDLKRAPGMICDEINRHFGATSHRARSAGRSGSLPDRAQAQTGA
jgi:IS30 family transposase